MTLPLWASGFGRQASGTALLLLPLLLTILLVSCDEDDPPSVLGQWRLVTIAGDSVPVEIEAPGDTFTVLTGALTIQPGTLTHGWELYGYGSSADDTTGQGYFADWTRTGDDVVVAIHDQWGLPGTRDTLFYEEGRIVDYAGEDPWVYERVTSDE